MREERGGEESVEERMTGVKRRTEGRRKKRRGMEGDVCRANKWGR